MVFFIVYFLSQTYKKAPNGLLSQKKISVIISIFWEFKGIFLGVWLEPTTSMGLKMGSIGIFFVNLRFTNKKWQKLL
jgi:hypothetical protein